MLPSLGALLFFNICVDCRDMIWYRYLMIFFVVPSLSYLPASLIIDLSVVSLAIHFTFSSVISQIYSLFAPRSAVIGIIHQSVTFWIDVRDVWLLSLRESLDGRVHEMDASEKISHVSVFLYLYLHFTSGCFFMRSEIAQSHSAKHTSMPRVAFCITHLSRYQIVA